MEREELLRLFPETLRETFGRQKIAFQEVREIRFRADRPVTLNVGGRECLLMEGQTPYIARKPLLKQMLSYMSGFSVYAFEEEMKQGFLTLAGGHRVGIAGKPVVQNGEVMNFHYIQGFHFRISHEVRGAGNEALPYLYERGGLCSTLIVSPPGFGKTTLLRDLIRMISNGNTYAEGMNVGVVDERSEIGGSYLGIPQNDLGMRTDILDDCPKAQGMIMLLRAMGPQVIAADELGGAKDVQAVRQIGRCGVKLLMTAHAADMEELLQRIDMQELFELKLFERFLILDRPGGNRRTFRVYDKAFRQIGGIS